VRAAPQLPQYLVIGLVFAGLDFGAALLLLAGSLLLYRRSES